MRSSCVTASRTVEAEVLARKDIRGRAVFRFFPAKAKGERLALYASDFATEIGGFVFGRQQKDGGLCLTDFVLPASDPRRDYVALFATSVGPGVRALAESWKDKGDYLRSHVLQAIAIESAEALAELLHERIRKMWGIGDPEGTTKKDLFQARYRGVRVSFGYPACPRLEDQAELFRLLGVTDAIGVELTEGFMMDPESSVSALVFHHPEARYFNLSEGDLESSNGASRARRLHDAAERNADQQTGHVRDVVPARTEADQQPVKGSERAENLPRLVA